jgi:hypothetical protein
MLSAKSEKSKWMRNSLVCIAAWPCAALLCRAQATAGTHPNADPPTASAADNSSAGAHSANVSFKNGIMTVSANNSDLDEILQQLAAVSGMTIDGLAANGPRAGAHVYGIYGPGASRDVITDLLVGTGCNYILVGSTTGGAPRQLVLLPRSQASPDTSAPTTNSAPASAASNSASAASEPAAPVVEQPSEPLGPGALPQTPQPSSDDNTRVQQNMLRLQHMQQQMQNSQQ